MRVLNVATLVTGGVLFAAAPAAAQDVAANILFGRPLEPGINVVWLKVNSQHDARTSPLYRTPSPETRARAQDEVRSDPTLRDFIERRDIQPQNVVAIQTAANGGKILFIR